MAEAGLAPPGGPGTTELLDHVLPVDLHAFCHMFLADGVCLLPPCFCHLMHDMTWNAAALTMRVSKGLETGVLQLGRGPPVYATRPVSAHLRVQLSVYTTALLHVGAQN